MTTVMATTMTIITTVKPGGFAHEVLTGSRRSLAALPLSVAAQSSYAGKTVTIVVGYKAGGGYDATARLLARHLPKHIPGKPTVIVQNMPGANSIIAANHMYNVAKPDGLTIGTFNRNLPIAQLTSVQGVKYDITSSSWIGSAANEMHHPRHPHRPALRELRRSEESEGARW